MLHASVKCWLKHLCFIPRGRINWLWFSKNIYRDKCVSLLVSNRFVCIMLVTLKARNIMQYSKEMWNSLIKTWNILEFSRTFHPHSGGSIISRVFRQFLEVNPPDKTWSSEFLRHSALDETNLFGVHNNFQLNCPGNCMIKGTFWNFPKYFIPKSVNSAYPSKGSHSIFLQSWPRVSLIVGTANKQTCAWFVFRLRTGGQEKGGVLNELRICQIVWMLFFWTIL